MNPNEFAQTKIEAMTGGMLLTTPLWTVVLDINLAASTIAAVCGAIIGVRAVWKMVTRGKTSEP
jgi:hypothetical protein